MCLLKINKSFKTLNLKKNTVPKTKNSDICFLTVCGWTVIMN